MIIKRYNIVNEVVSETRQWGWRGGARRSDRGKGTGYVIRFSKSEYTARTCLHNNVIEMNSFDILSLVKRFI